MEARRLIKINDAQISYIALQVGYERPSLIQPSINDCLVSVQIMTWIKASQQVVASDGHKADINGQA